MFEYKYNLGKYIDDENGSEIYFNTLQKEEVSKQKTYRLSRIIEDITNEKFIDPDKYLDIQINRDNQTLHLIKSTEEEIKEYDKACEEIYNNYEVYDNIIDVNCNDKLNLYFKENCMIKYIKYVKDTKGKTKMIITTEDDKDAKPYYSCICSQSNCSNLCLIKHKKTKIVFCIGDNCIKKFNKSLYNDVNTNIRNKQDCNNEPCNICGCKLYNTRYLDNDKNYDKELFQDEKICIDCWINIHITIKIKMYFNEENAWIGNERFKTIKNYFKFSNSDDNDNKICQNKYCGVPLRFITNSNHIKNANKNDRTYCNECYKNNEVKDYENKMIKDNYWKKCIKYDKCNNIIKFIKENEDRCDSCINNSKNHMISIGKWKICKNVKCIEINKNPKIDYCKTCNINIKSNIWKECDECNVIIKDNTTLKCTDCIKRKEILKLENGTWRRCKNTSCMIINKFINKDILYCKECNTKLKNNIWRNCIDCNYIIKDTNKWKKKCYNCYMKST